MKQTTQAIYKQWVVDYEFPISKEQATEIGKPKLEGKPYKSSGDKMVWNDELDQEIPEGWNSVEFGDLVERICVVYAGSLYESYCEKEHGIPMVLTTDLTEFGMSYSDLKYVLPQFQIKNKKSQLMKGDILVARHRANEIPATFDREFEANCLNTIIVKPNESVMLSKLAHSFLKSDIAMEQVRSSLGGSVQDVLNTKKLSALRLAYPKKGKLNNRVSPFLKRLQNAIENTRNLLEQLYIFRDLVLSKITKAEATA